MADTAALQATLFDEMKARLKADDSRSAHADGAYEYFSKYVPGGQYSVLCRSPRRGGEENRAPRWQ